MIFVPMEYLANKYEDYIILNGYIMCDLCGLNKSVFPSEVSGF